MSEFSNKTGAIAPNTVQKIQYIRSVALFIFGLSLIYGQRTINNVTFEAAGGYSTSITEFTDDAHDYFCKVNWNDDNPKAYDVDGNLLGDLDSPRGLNSVQGSYFFAGMDIDGEGASLPVTLTIDDIDISGYTDLQLKVYLAEDDDGSNQDWDAVDYVHFDYDIDNSGSFSNLLHIESSGGQNTEPSIDTNFDGSGDGTAITNTFTLFSADISGTGSLLDIKVTFNLQMGEEDIAIDDISVTGMPTVTIGDESADAGWRMLCLPKTSGIVTDISDDTPVQGITGGDDASADPNFYINTASDGTGTDGWTDPTNVTTAWGDGLGFILFFFDNTSNGSSTLPVTLDISGSEPSSDVTVTLSDTYTLVGNPFASNIELDDITGNNSEDGVQNGLKSPISVWTDGAGTDNSGSWSTYQLDDSKIVSTWQGFFLERNSGSTDQLTIPTSAKTSSAATISIFSKMMMTNRRTIELRLDAPNGNVDIANKFYFTEISHEGEDGFDGGKLLPLDGSPSLAFIQEFDGEERLLVQDARAYQPEEDQTCELAILDAGVSGTYQISWPVMDNIPSDWEITLTDLETGAVVNMQEEEFYTFDIQNPIGQLNTNPLQPVTVDANAVYRNTVPARFSVTISGFALGSENGSLPVEFALHPAYPNPFNPTTTITIDVPVDARHVSQLQIYNITGQLIETLINGKLESGEYDVVWDAGNLPSGIYFVQLKSGDKTITQKLTLLK